ncbi:MAG: hypothetical protein JOZ54_10330 [Acidobacteria bacterium]|nr:hypothetical protein [Acidobacteriota bacterium]
MRSNSVKSSVFALVLALTLSTASPLLAAARQTRERDRSPIERIVVFIKRLIGAQPHDGIIPPHPDPEENH